MEDRITELEKKAAFQEHLLAQLNEIVREQEKKIALLEKQIKAVKDQARPEDMVRPLSEETPPPHY
ncbi:MAG: SlyX family protein [Candidatus Omnitrophica bacterium]|nr:SlyX family protein [Candidatus Omnitrophota bacterium]